MVQADDLDYVVHMYTRAFLVVVQVYVKIPTVTVSTRTANSPLSCLIFLLINRRNGGGTFTYEYKNSFFGVGCLLSGHHQCTRDFFSASLCS